MAPGRSGCSSGTDGSRTRDHVAPPSLVVSITGRAIGRRSEPPTKHRSADGQLIAIALMFASWARSDCTFQCAPPSVVATIAAGFTDAAEVVMIAQQCCASAHDSAFRAGCSLLS